MANGIAHRERLELAQTLAGSGPGAPTLCAGWDTAHLAAHLIVRDGRPDVQLETLLRPHSDRVTRVLDNLATGTSYPQLVRRVQRGAALSLARLTVVDDKMNTAEFAIHHEDVRRAAPGWEPRSLPGDLLAGLWQSLGLFGRLAGRSLRAPAVLTDGAGRTHVLRRGPEPAVVTGEPLELLLFVAGRAGVARVEFSGPEKSVQALRASRFSL